MDAVELLAAWKESQACGAHGFYEEFHRRTGLSEAKVKQAFHEWNLTPRSRVEEIADKHGVTLREGGFQAFLAERIQNPEMDSQG